jgi:hypothetical protein
VVGRALGSHWAWTAWIFPSQGAHWASAPPGHSAGVVSSVGCSKYAGCFWEFVVVPCWLRKTDTCAQPLYSSSPLNLVTYGWPRPTPPRPTIVFPQQYHSHGVSLTYSLTLMQLTPWMFRAYAAIASALRQEGLCLFHPASVFK